VNGRRRREAVTRQGSRAELAGRNPDEKGVPREHAAQGQCGQPTGGAPCGWPGRDGGRRARTGQDGAAAGSVQNKVQMRRRREAQQTEPAGRSKEETD